MKIPPRPQTNSPKASSWKPGQDIMWGDMMIAPDHPKYNEYASRLRAGEKPPGGMPLPPNRTQPKLDPSIKPGMINMEWGSPLEKPGQKEQYSQSTTNPLDRLDNRNATVNRSVPQPDSTKSSTEKYWENFVKSGRVPTWANDYPNEWQRLEDRYMKPKGWENIPKEIAPNKSANSGLSEINKKFLQNNQNFQQNTTNTANPLDKLDKITQARDIHGNEIDTADMLVSGGVKLQNNQRAGLRASGGSGGNLQFRMVDGQVRVLGSDAQKNASGAKSQPQPTGMTFRPTTDEEKKIYSGMR
jgi:hypothetical protein